MKHEDDASDGEDDEEKTGDPSEAKREGEPKTMALHLRREDVEEEVVEDQHGPFQVSIRHPRSEDGLPDV